MPLSKIATVIGVVGLSATLVGCMSHIPLAEQYPQTSQKKVLAAGHWELLAQDVVANTNAALDRVGVGSSTTLYVELPPRPSAFDVALRDFLITGLVQKGKAVVDHPDSAVAVVSYNAQIVTHRSTRYYSGQKLNPTPHELVLSTTVTSAGLYLVRDTDIYYFEDDDAYLFARSSMKPVVMEVVN